MDSVNYQVDHGTGPPSSTLSSYSHSAGGSRGALPHPALASQRLSWSQHTSGQRAFVESPSNGPLPETSPNYQSNLPPLRSTLYSFPESTPEGAGLPLPMPSFPPNGLLWNHAPYQPYIPMLDQQAGHVVSGSAASEESFLLPPMARQRLATDQHRNRAENASALNSHTRARNDRPSASQASSLPQQPRHVSHTSPYRHQRQRPNSRWLGPTPSLGLTHAAASAERRRQRARSELQNSSARSVNRHNGHGIGTEADATGQPETGRRRGGIRDNRLTQSEDADAAQQMRLQELRSLIAQHPRRVASRATLQSMQSVDIKTLPKDERTCSICYNDFGVDSPEGVNEAPLRLPKCKHVFGDHCIKKWFEDSDKCPYCRHKLPSEPKGSEAARQFLTMMRLRGQTPMDMPRETLVSLLEVSEEMDLYQDSLSSSPSSDDESAEESPWHPEPSSPRSRPAAHRSHPQTAQPRMRPAPTEAPVDPPRIPPIPYMADVQFGVNHRLPSASYFDSERPPGSSNRGDVARNGWTTSESDTRTGSQPTRSQPNTAGISGRPLPSDDDERAIIREYERQRLFIEQIREYTAAEHRDD